MWQNYKCTYKSTFQLFTRKTSVNCLSLSWVELYGFLVVWHYIVDFALSKCTNHPVTGINKLHIKASQISPVKHYSVGTSTCNFIAEKNFHSWYYYIVDNNLNLSTKTNTLKTTFSVTQEANFQLKNLCNIRIQIHYIK